MADAMIQITIPQANAVIPTVVTVLGSYALTLAKAMIPPTITCEFEPELPPGPNVQGTVTVNEEEFTWSAEFDTLPGGTSGHLIARLGANGPSHFVPVTTLSSSGAS